MRRTPALVLSLLLAIALVATACGSDDKPKAGSATTTKSTTKTSGAGAAAGGCTPKGDVSIGYSTPLPQAAFDLLIRAMKADADKAGYQFSSTVANADPGKQISDIDSLVQKNIDVLIVAPTAEQAILPALQRARQAGVKVVGHDVKGDLAPYDANVGSDAANASTESAAYLERLVGGGKVAAVKGPTFAPALIERNDSFDSGAKAAGLSVAAQETNVAISPDGARQIADRWRQQFGADLKGIWTFNDVSAVGVASALQGSFKPAIVSINGDPEGIAAVKAGTVAATWDLNPVLTAHTLMWAGEQLLCGKKVPDNIFTPSTRIDKDNVSEWVPHEDRIDPTAKVVLEQRDGKTYVKLPTR